MSDNTLVPATVAAPSVPVVTAPDLPAVVTDEEANQAAKDLGMTFFNAEKTRKLKKIGMFRAAQSVVYLGVGRLAACDDALQQLLATAVEIAQDDQEDAERRIGALIAGRSIVDTIQKGIGMEVEFQTERLISDRAPMKKRSFDAADTPIIPIQAASGSTVNINVDQKPVEPQTPKTV